MLNSQAKPFQKNRSVPLICIYHAPPPYDYTHINLMFHAKCPAPAPAPPFLVNSLLPYENIPVLVHHNQLFAMQFPYFHPPQQLVHQTTTCSPFTKIYNVNTRFSEVKREDDAFQKKKKREDDGVGHTSSARSFTGLRRSSFVKRKRKILEQTWVPKTEGGSNRKIISSPFDIKESEASLQEKTTLMIKNLPCKISRARLIDILDQHCTSANQKDGIGSSVSEYDFLYLPFAFKSGLNLGYAFVNFTTTVGAMKFYKSYQKYMWNKEYSSHKICEIKYAKLQGRDELLKHFQGLYFGNEKEEFMPIMFSPPRSGCTSNSCSTTLGRRGGAS